MNASLERLRRRREQEGHERGFTLIELLIVIVILGILAAIVVFAVGAVTSKSTNAACQADFKTVQTAEEAYKAQMGSYPASVGVLTGSPTDAQGFTVGPWLKSLPSTSHYTISDNGSGVLSVAAGTGSAVSGTDPSTACSAVK